MASTADAETALSALLWNALTPLAATVKVIRGWPSPSALDNEIKAGNIVVSVYRLQVSQNTTRYLEQTATPVIPAPTLTAAATGGVATFAGVAGAGQIAGVIANGIAYSVRTQANDTPSSVAIRIGALMPAPAAVSGAQIAAPGLSDARTAMDAQSVYETGRLENTLQADLWCPTPDARDQAEALVLPAVSRSTFLTMPDGTQARVRIGSVLATDETSALTIYRLMIRVTAEIVLGASEVDPIALWPNAALHPSLI